MVEIAKVYTGSEDVGGDDKVGGDAVALGNNGPAVVQVPAMCQALSTCIDSLNNNIVVIFI